MVSVISWSRDNFRRGKPTGFKRPPADRQHSARHAPHDRTNRIDYGLDRRSQHWSEDERHDENHDHRHHFYRNSSGFFLTFAPDAIAQSGSLLLERVADIGSLRLSGSERRGKVDYFVDSASLPHL